MMNANLASEKSVLTFFKGTQICIYRNYVGNVPKGPSKPSTGARAMGPYASKILVDGK